MAFKFISALYSDETVMNLWQYGIEGVNYQLLDDGTAYFVDGEDGSNYAYHQNTGWAMGNQFNSLVWNDGSKEADYWDKLAHHNDWAYYSPAFGFAWDSTQYATQVTALTNAYETYRAALDTGSVGSANVESTLKALNDALYAAGLQDVIDAKQAQLDEYLASHQ
jgi:putative aldouronate transport system substrate-binding protein